MAADDRQALRSGDLGRPPRSHHAGRGYRFYGFKGVRSGAHRGNCRGRGAEAGPAAARSGDLSPRQHRFFARRRESRGTRTLFSRSRRRGVDPRSQVHRIRAPSPRARAASTGARAASTRRPRTRKQLSYGYLTAGSARSLPVRRSHRHRHGRESIAQKENRSARRQLSDRSQYQLYELLYRILLLLRLLPANGLQGRLRPFAGYHPGENRRDYSPGRHRYSHAGWIAFRSAHRLLRKSAALDQTKLPANSLALFFGAGSALHRRSLKSERARYDRPP